jgi:uncharacterized membrane protein YesL
MRDIFRVIWAGVQDFWDELFLLALMNIVTMLLAIPVITFPPALAALWHVANRVADGTAIHWSDYGDGLRRYFLKSWGLALINILILVIILTNIWFYGPTNNPLSISEKITPWLQGFFIVVGLLWLIYQMYPLAMLLEQTDQRLHIALRNSFILVIANPLFTLVLAVFILVVVAVSTYLVAPWILVTWALIAVVINKAVKHMLKPFRERMKAEAEEENGEEEGKSHSVDKESDE